MSSAEIAHGVEAPKTAVEQRARCPRASGPARIALVLVVLAGLVLRMTGIGFMLPHQGEPDGLVIDKQVEILRGGARAHEAQRLSAFYPHLVADLAAALPQPAPQGAAHVAAPLTLAEHLARARSRRLDIRIVVALLSLLAIPGTWWLARRWLPESWSLVAAALLATSVFHIWFAQQARPHAAEASLALLAVLSAIGLRRRGGWSAYVVTGIAVALALGCLQNGSAVLPAVGVAVLLRWRARLEPAWRLVLGSLIVAAGAVLALLLFYPFVFDAPRKADIGTQGSMVHLSGHIVDLAMFNGRGFATVARSLWEYDPSICALAALGLVIAAAGLVRRRFRTRADVGRDLRDELWIVLAFVIPYLVAIGMYQRTYQRFVLPLVPYECALAAWALWRATVLASRAGAVARRCALVLALALVLFQCFAAWKLVHVRAQPDTITQAARWIESHAAPSARVSVLPTIDLPLLESQAARTANMTTMADPAFPWFLYQVDLPPGAFEGDGWNLYAMPLATDAKRTAARADPVAFVRDQHADYVALEVFAGARRPFLGSIRAAAAAQGELVARISPDAVDRGENLPLVYQDDEYPYTTPWFARVLRARCVGPVVEIYKLR